MRALKRAVADRFEELAVVILVLAGVMLRARGYLWGASDLWLDEASWALRLFDRPLGESWLRPVGFLALSRLLVRSFGASELVLRAVPWCAGVATVLLAPALSRRLFTRTAARLSLVATLALHPAAVDLAKEFKPYALSLSLHLGLVLLALRYLHGGGRRALAGALGLATLGSVLAQDVALALPGLFLLMLAAARRQQRAELWLVAGVALVILGGFAAQYWAIWRHRPEGVSADWGVRWDVFHTPEHVASYPEWLLRQGLDVAALPSAGRELWQADWLTPGAHAAVGAGYRFLWLWLHALGCWVIVKERRLHAALLLLLPLLLLVVFNALGLWPLGAFRTNLFALLYTAAIAATALDTRWVDRAPRAASGAVLLLALAPPLLFDRDFGATKRMFTRESRFVELMERVARQPPGAAPGGRRAVILDAATCDVWRYYADVHPRLSRTLGRAVAASVSADCLAGARGSAEEEAERSVRSGRNGWYVTRSLGAMPEPSAGPSHGVRWLDPIDFGSHVLVPFTGP